MNKKFIRRWMPNTQRFNDHKILRIFGKFVQDPNLWHLNRLSVAKAFLIGVFCAMLPIPFHTLIAVVGAIIGKANLPITIALVWAIANPFVLPLLYFICYKVGIFILQWPPRHFHVKLTFEWLINEFMHIGAPLLLGGFILGLLLGILSYFLVQFLWRLNVKRDWKKRQSVRQKLPSHQ